MVAITGSFGKTSTKQHVAHLVAGSRTVVASPASFNNRAGLARAVNEQLTPGTDVFVAEMGTYGKGEIAELCRWCPPAIAVITAIGPVHLERFKTEEAIVAAKSEITETAHTVVLNVDDPRLAALADRLAAAGTKSVVRCSAVDPSADVCVVAGRRRGARSTSAGRSSAPGVALPGSVQPTNLACALAVAFALGVPHEVALARIARLPPVANRLASAQAPSGVWVIDDTFNSNPSGARVALAELAGPRRRRAPGGRHPGHGRARPAPVRGESSLRRGDRRRGHRPGDRRPHQPAGPAGRVVAAAARSSSAPGRRPWPGSAPRSGRATPCCTRTICRTTTVEAARPRAHRPVRPAGAPDVTEARDQSCLISP